MANTSGSVDAASGRAYNWQCPVGWLDQRHREAEAVGVAILEEEGLMKVIATHSHKGGTGKSTLAMLLAKHAAERGETVCVVDYDFIGAGLMDFVDQDGLAKGCVGEFLADLSANPLRVADILGKHDGFSVILGVRSERTRGDVLDAVANEPHYRTIETKTKILIGELQWKGFGIVIFDCHAGIAYLSESIAYLSDLNLYVTTPDLTPDALRAVLDARGLKDETAMIVFNRWRREACEPVGSWDAAVPESEEFGSRGDLATVDTGKLEFCSTVMRRLFPSTRTP